MTTTDITAGDAAKLPVGELMGTYDSRYPLIREAIRRALYLAQFRKKAEHVEQIVKRRLGRRRRFD